MQRMFRFSILVFFFSSASWCAAQDAGGQKRFTNMPLVVSVNFNAIASPFHKLGNNFKNVGIRIGTEVPWNPKGNLRQSVNVGYYRNRLNGDGLYVNSELIYRPQIAPRVNVDLRIGPGFANIFLPTQPYQQDGNGRWIKASNPGKPALQIHMTGGVSYGDFVFSNVRVASFLQYEIVGTLNYNRSVPVLPASFVHAGSRIQF